MRKLRILAICIIGILLLLTVAIPVFAQIEEPDSFFGVQQIESYRSVQELNDILFLIIGRVEYVAFPTVYDISEAFIVRFMDGAVERGTTSFYAYHDSGYDLGVCSIYFTADEVASLPITWSGAYTVSIEGNPTLHWLDTTAVTAMDGALIYDADDVPGYTDQTAESNSAAANDMDFPPSDAADIGDIYYFGSSGMFNILTVNIGTQGDWTGTYAWEYWNGAAWTAVSGLTDGTVGFTAAVGNHDVTFTCPVDWRLTTVNAVELYWLRFRIVTEAAHNITPLGTQSWTNTLATPPSTSSGTINWFDEGSVAAAQARLTTRLRSLATIVENDWGAPEDLIESIAGTLKFTDSGEDYFGHAIDDLRAICPDLFRDVLITPEFDETAVVQDFYMGGDDTDYEVFGVNWYAQTFTASATYPMSGIDLKMFREGEPGTVTASLRATAAGVPTLADLASGAIDGDEFSENTNGEWIEIAFTTDYTVVSGTTYAIVVRATTGSATDYAGWRVDTNGVYAGQACIDGADSGATWTGIAGEDFMFSVRALDTYTMSYRNRLAYRLVGTRLDMTALAAHINMSRVWFSTMLWVIFACMLPTVFVCRAADSFKPATLVFMIMLPFGALAGFVYLEVAIVAAFFCASLAIYTLWYKGSP